MSKQSESCLSAINFLEKLYGEIAQFVTSFNKLVGDEWENAKNSSAVTYNNSQSIDNPDRWLTKSIAKYFKSNKGQGNYLGICIILKNENTDLPIVIGGKMILENDDLGESDLEFLWFKEGPENKEWGKVYELKNDKYKYSGKLFAYPLFEIKNKEDIKSKIYDKIAKL